jgi:hypothetical protein
MFIGLSEDANTNSVRRSGIQLELQHSSIVPLLRTGPEGFCASIYKHATPNGVKAPLPVGRAVRSPGILLV